MKQLIVNADDFGLDPAVNAAVARAHTEGILTSASLLITAPYAAEAVALARSQPTLGVGIHLCLVQGNDTTGRPLPATPGALAAQLTLHPRRIAFIETELRAQVDCFLATGLQPTHLDTHQHTHLDPRILRIVGKLAREYRVAFVRAPVEPLLPSLRCSRQRWLRKLARAAVFGTFGASAKKQLRRLNLRTTDRAVGVLDSGHMTESFVSAYLDRLPDGLTEIFSHPATAATAALRQQQTRYENTAELAALCGPRLRDQIARLGICLTNFRSLATAPSVPTL